MLNDYLEREFGILADTISKLNLYKNDYKKIFISNDISIREFHAQLPEWSLRREMGRSYFLHYKSPSTGGDLLEPPKSHTLEEELEHNSLQMLKTYHWLLADAYEAFEDFLVKAYAYCGLEGVSIWQRPRGWNNEGSRKIKDYETGRKPYEQIRAFRHSSPYFAKYETDSPTGTNYRVTFVLIEKLRHITVHSEGYHEDMNRLIDKMQAELTGEDIALVRDYVNSYFIPHERRSLVDLLEYAVEDEPEGGGFGYYDPMLGLFRSLVEYGQLIKESIQVHLKTK